jgi:hypothetical protein
MNLVRDLRRSHAKHYSQNGEDGVIERILEIVGVTNRRYVEFGAGSGEECNTRWLREQGWTGLLMDYAHQDPALALYQEFITAENINELLEKYEVPASFDLLSIDIDGNDYWVWKAISPRYRPRVVVIEYNAGLPADVPVTMPYDPEFRWRGQPHTGQSLLAVKKLSLEKGYSLVYARPPNAFLVLSSILPPGYREISAGKASGSLWRVLNFSSRARWNSELKRMPWVYV